MLPDSKDEHPTHAAVRQCGTCHWWGLSGAGHHHTLNLGSVRPCEIPVPVWLDKGWSSPAYAGDACRTWKPIA
jgi:hypothetical protein